MSDKDPSTQRLEDTKNIYLREKNKRASGKGRGIQEITGELGKYLDDPYLPVTPREAIDDEVDVICVGAGFAGLLVGARMKEAGFDRVRLLDAAGDVGGVWYWNRYPEAKCDVESLIYMPLLEETGYIPTMRYAAAPEIGAHARRIAQRFDLYRDAVFHTAVTEIVWDKASLRWHVHTNRGDDMRARFVVLCNGPLSRVKLPDIPGITDFTGKAFHTSRWDYQYTGGSPKNLHLDGLADKTVGFIGTGATGLQCVAPLGQSAGELYVFQRTPSTVGPRDNGPIDRDYVRDLSPGWQKRRQENFTKINFGLEVDQDLINDGWTDLFGELYRSPRYAGLTGDNLAREKELVDFEKMERIRDRIDTIVEDPETARALKPYYNYLCKRAGWHDEYLNTFNIPTVHLVDTDGAGVERITEHGVVANGKEYKLDCLIFGTGFETETGGRLRMGFDVTGRYGLTLKDKWADGLVTLHGLMTAGFPNLFIVPGINSQAVVTTNVIHMTQEYAAHFAYIAKKVTDAGADCFDISSAAEDDWVKTILERRIDRTAFLDACTPGRNNYEGATMSRPAQNTVFGGGPIEYFGLLEAWRKSEQLPGVDLLFRDGDRRDAGHRQGAADPMTP